MKECSCCSLAPAVWLLGSQGDPPAASCASACRARLARAHVCAFVDGLLHMLHLKRFHTCCIFCMEVSSPFFLQPHTCTTASVKPWLDAWSIIGQLVNGQCGGQEAGFSCQLHPGRCCGDALDALHTQLLSSGCWGFRGSGVSGLCDSGFWGFGVSVSVLGGSVGIRFEPKGHASRWGLLEASARHWCARTCSGRSAHTMVARRGSTRKPPGPKVSAAAHRPGA